VSLDKPDIKAVRRDVERRMQGAVDTLQKEFGGLRTGRAATSLLEPITVTAYGSQMPLSQVGTIGVPEPRMLTVQVWDRSLVKAAEKAIRDSDLGLNPSVDGQLLRIPIPPLTQERRAELAKVAGKYAEEARIAVRNIRRHVLDEFKRAEKEGVLSQDEQRDYAGEVQGLTDTFVKKVDEVLEKKEQEIMQV
jgi:ribosome recycling factor